MSIIPFPIPRSAAAATEPTTSERIVKTLDDLKRIFAQRRPSAVADLAAAHPEEFPPEIVELPSEPLTKAEIKRRGMAALQRLTGFIGGSQLKVLPGFIRGEDGQGYMEILERLAGIVESMPVTYGQDGKGDDAIVYLHYFTGAYDGYVTEKDMEEPDNPAEAQWQAHGYVHWAQNGPHLSMGYICLPEIFGSNAELDFHFTPCTVREIKRKHGVIVDEAPAADECLNSDSDEREPFPKPPDNAPPEPVSGHLHIKIHRAEGYSEECTTHHYGDFATAWACLQAHGHTAPAGGGYDKTDIVVTFPDGDTYSYRHDMTRGGFADDDGLDLPAHILQSLRFYTGQWTPDWMIANGRVNKYAKTPDPEAVSILNKWESILTLEPPVTTDPLVERQKEFLAMKDGFQPGAIVTSITMYEDTHVHYHRIIARSGNLITLQALDTVITEVGKQTMTGTSMPVDKVAHGNKDSRHRLTRGLDDKPFLKIGKRQHAHLWDGLPQRCSWYG